MKIQIYFTIVLLISTTTLSIAQQPASFTHAAAMDRADTTHFFVNSKGGWLLYNSYLANKEGDTVCLELILQRTDDIKWNEWQLVGTIKAASFQPGTARCIRTRLLKAELEVEVQPKGSCYLRVIAGELDTVNPKVIPLTIYYKK